MRVYAIFASLLFLNGIISCKSRTKKEEFQLLTYHATISSLCGRIVVKIPAPTKSLVWCQPNSPSSDGVVQNEIDFVINSDTGHLFISTPLRANTEEGCPVPLKINDEVFEQLENIIHLQYRHIGHTDRRILVRGKSQFYCLGFNTGFYLHGCKNGAYFEIGIFNVRDSTIKDSILNSIQVGEDIIQ